MRPAILALMLALASILPVKAEFFTSEQAAMFCSEKPEWCWAFVGGAHDAFEDMHIANYVANRQMPAFCVMPNTGLSDLAEEFAKYLKDGDYNRNLLASQVLYGMLKERHPCP